LADCGLLLFSEHKSRPDHEEGYPKGMFAIQRNGAETENTELVEQETGKGKA
jgi:hypothetical protein